MYYGDFTDRGALDLLKRSVIRCAMIGAARMRDALANAYPPLMARFRRTGPTASNDGASDGAAAQSRRGRWRRGRWPR